MSKIKIEDIINKRFTENQLKNALDFTAHLRELDLSLKEFDSVCVYTFGFYKLTADSDWECIKQMVTAKKNDIDNMQRT